MSGVGAVQLAKVPNKYGLLAYQRTSRNATANEVCLPKLCTEDAK